MWLQCGSCDYQKKAHEIEKPLIEEVNSTHRVITETDKHELKSSLDKLLSTLVENPNTSAFGCTSSLGFSSELINDVVDNAHFSHLMIS